MGTAVERDEHTALGVVSRRQIAREQHRADTRDVAAECQCEQIELELDVLIEGRRHTDRHRHLGGGRCRRIRGYLESPFDLTHVLGVVSETERIGRADVGPQTRERAAKRVEYAALPIAPRGTLLWCAAVPEHPLEYHQGAQLHWQPCRR